MLQGEIDANGNMKKPGREKVFTRLVGSHVADYLKVASDTLKEDNFILLINQKMVSFVGGMDEDKTYTFDGLPITEKNIRVSNGIIHKIGGLISYSPNIWEYLDGAAEADSVKEFLYSFNKSEFDPYLSIEGPTVNGDKTYIDSVFTNSNQWLYYGYSNATAGFGDIVVTTALAKIISLLVTVYSTLVISIVTGVVVNFYTEITELSKKETLTAFMDKLEHLDTMSKEELKEISQQVEKFNNNIKK